MTPSQHLSSGQVPLKSAIVLAAFGTTDSEAVGAIVNIKNRVMAAFPDHEIHLAFTSGFIRKIWRKRGDDEKFRRSHPDLPQEIYAVTSVLSLLTNLIEFGQRPSIKVQSLHMTDGIEYQDLKAVVTALGSINTVKPENRPFPNLKLGPSTLADGGEAGLRRAAEALRPLALQAQEAGAALILMGHGHEQCEPAAYLALETHLKEIYPLSFIGLLEAEPGLAQVVAALEHRPDRPAAALLAPLMVLGGHHAKIDLAGDHAQSWAQVFKAQGYQVTVRLQGLGFLESWAGLYVESLRRL